MDKLSGVAPSLYGKAYHCPFCGVYAKVNWGQAFKEMHRGYSPTMYRIGTGECCSKHTLWRVEHDNAMNEVGFLIYPASKLAPLPTDDMPEDVRADYLEAREIAEASPRAAAALLRLAIQKLCKHLGGEGRKINDDIGALVRKGLPVRVQQALDVVRVVGNNAVHPGELSADDVAGVVTSLFALINFIVENQITQDKAMQAMYEALPAGAQAAVAKRDGSTP